MSREYRFICEICHRLPARFVCRLCGRRVCINCYDPYDELCIECSKRESESETYPTLRERGVVTSEVNLGVKLFMYGFTLSFLGAILMMFSSLVGGETSGGFIIFVWPFPPIISAWGPQASLVFFILAVIALLALVYFVLKYFTSYKTTLQRRSS